VRLLRGETAEAAFERAPDRRKPRRGHSLKESRSLL
jgi:hypothetical protein